MDTGHSINLIFASIGTFWAFGQMLVFCNLGEIVTNQFCKINNTLYYCNWYTFPSRLQKILPIVMISAQELVVIQSFASLSCTRDAFKKVIDFSI